MDSKQVKIAITVADKLSFSDAAFELSYSPSVITKQIQSLERELGVKLFERKARAKVDLTSEGKRIIPLLQVMDYDHENVLSKVKELSHQKTGKLTFACPTPIGTLRDEDVLSDFFFLHPQIDVTHFSISIQEILHRMGKNEIDAGMGIVMADPKLNGVFNSVDFADDLEFIPIESLEMHLAFSEKHPMAGKDVVKLSDFKNDTFVFKVDGGEVWNNGGRLAAFQAFCREEGFEPKIRVLDGMRNKTIIKVVEQEKLICPIWNNIDFFFRGRGIVSAKLSRNYMPARSMVFYRKSNHSPELKAFCRSCMKTVQDRYQSYKPGTDI